MLFRSTFSVRMDKNLKQQFDSLCEEFGMTTTTAFNVFARAVVRSRKIPFEIKSATDSKETLEKGRNAFYELRKSAKENNLGNMSLDDINSEISQVRDKTEK